MDKNNVKCVYCDNNNVNYKDHYKYEIKKDNEYLGIMDIYECINCKLTFSYPMPDEKKINHFSLLQQMENIQVSKSKKRWNVLFGV